jgi:hypothetical protein
VSRENTYRCWEMDAGHCVGSDLKGRWPLEAFRKHAENWQGIASGRYLVAKIDPGSFLNTKEFGIFVLTVSEPVPTPPPFTITEVTS